MPEAPSATGPRRSWVHHVIILGVAGSAGLIIGELFVPWLCVPSILVLIGSAFAVFVMTVSGKSPVKRKNPKRTQEPTEERSPGQAQTQYVSVGRRIRIGITRAFDFFFSLAP